MLCSVDSSPFFKSLTPSAPPLPSNSSAAVTKLSGTELILGAKEEFTVTESLSHGRINPQDLTGPAMEDEAEEDIEWRMEQFSFTFF